MAAASAIQTGKARLHATSGCRRPCARAGSHRPRRATAPADGDADGEEQQEQPIRPARTTGDTPRAPAEAPRSRRPSRLSTAAEPAERPERSQQPAQQTLRCAWPSPITRTQATTPSGSARTERYAIPTAGLYDSADSPGDVEERAIRWPTAAVMSTASSAVTMDTTCSPVRRMRRSMTIALACRAACDRRSCRRRPRS